MRILAQKPNQPQRRESFDLSTSKALASAGSFRTHPQAAQLLEFNPETLEVESGLGAAARCAHDFSRMPVYDDRVMKSRTNLTVNTPGNAYEQEADSVEDEVTSMPHPKLQRACACGGECPKCQADSRSQLRELLQTKGIEPNHSAATSAPPVAHEALRSPGQPLDSGIRMLMENRFGYDFSHVRVHTDAKAAESARAVSALAYSVGPHIVFGPGQYVPGSRNGQGLLAHELTHVVQQRGNQALQRKEDSNDRVDPKACPNADAAIMSWGFQQAVDWVKLKNAHKGRPPTVLDSRVWKTFEDWHEVDIDIPFMRHSDSPIEHVKWRVQPVLKNEQWILESTITEWWDGHPIVFYLPAGLTRDSGGQCTIENVPRPPRKPSSPSPEPGEEAPT